jgi:AraC-like DNA-binding protein
MKADIYLILALLVMIISGVIALFNRKKNKNTLYLSVFLAVLGVEALVSWHFYTDTSNVKIFAVLLNHFAPLYTLKAPLIYFFVRGNIRDNYKLTRSDFLHFTPALLHLILIIPYLLLPFSEKIDTATFIKEYPHLYTYADFHYPYPHLWNQYFRAAQLVIYTFLSTVLLVRFMKMTPALPAELRKLYRLSATWIQFLLVAFFLVGSFQLVIVLQPALAGNALQAFENATHIFRFSLVIYILVPLILLLYPKFLYGFPSLRVLSSNSPVKSIDLPVIASDEAVSDFSTHISTNIEQLYDDIKTHIYTHQLYLKPGFSIGNLSESMGIPEHQLMLCMDIQSEKNFQNLVNEYRIKYVIDCVKTLQDNLSPEMLSTRSGFSSVFEFQEAFLKYSGLSFRSWYALTMYKGK